jgi:hypothetical protein
MKKEVSEVLKKEQNNESCIHLYLEECGWCAYNLQLVGKNKVDKNLFIHWKKNI